MIIRGVRVHPFGGLADRSIELAPGLNVVLGANEAGKSTLFNAVRTCLFVPTRLSKPNFARLIAPYLPAAGGDFLQVDLELGVPDGVARLSRRWGSAPFSSLHLPEGATISDESGIQERLSRMLPASPSTVANILMIHQWQLLESMEAMRSTAKESLADLSDVIRRTLLNVGGVSPDRFLARLDELHAAAFTHWDALHHGPEGNRGIENPWKKEIGTILRAWYDQEAARSAWKKSLAFEGGVDAVNAQLRAVSGALSAREAFVTAHTEAARDARERRTEESELGRVLAESEAFRAAWREWPVVAHAAEQLRAEVVTAEAARAPLERELKEAQRGEQSRGLRERHARVTRLATAVDAARAALESVPQLDAKALSEIRAASLSYERLHAQAEAQGLSVTIAGRSAVALVIQEDAEPEKKTTLEAGATARARAGDRMRISHPDMEIVIQAGGDAHARAEKTSSAKQALDELCARHGVADPSAAEEAARRYESLAAELVSAQRNLGSELAGDSAKGLSEQVAALGPVEETHPLAVLAAEHATMVAQGQAREKELAGLTTRLESWERMHGSQDGLLDRLAEAKSRENELRARIAKLAPVPKEFAEVGAFLKEFETAQSDCTSLRVELRGLQVRKEELEKTGPDQSAEELARLVKDAEEAFRACLRRGEALGRIATQARGLLGKDTDSLYDGMRVRLEEILSAITGGKHARVSLSGALPATVADEKGASLSWEQLSAGTRDGLGLALRLAMADFFLGSADGFLLMDDPLVDMDPERQKRAAEALRSFAATRQLILFTCHPSTAASLEGRVVTLAG
jgi:exonuclease SbcC